MTAGTLVSVVLPTRNRGKFLRRAIDSVLGQTYRNLELIVVDDASTDGTPDLLASYDDPRLEHIRLGSRRGAPAARNAGIDRARGAVLAFQDSDDAWRPDKLALQLPVLERAGPDTAVVYCPLIRHGERGATPVPDPLDRRARSGDLSSVLVHGNLISTQTAVARAEAVQAVGGFDERMPRLQEWDLWLTMAEHYRFAFVDVPLVDAYETVDSISRDRAAYFDALELILRKHDRLFRRAPVARARIETLLAQGRLERRDVLGSFRHFRHAVLTAPRFTASRTARSGWAAVRRRGMRDEGRHTA